MLRVNRFFGADERWSKASAFAAAFRGGCWPGTGNESKISRWETATLRVPYQAIRRYEQLLELPPGLLTATADNIHGYYCADQRCPGAGGWSLPRQGEVPVTRIGELIDKASSTEVMTGQEWDELTREIAAVPNFFISPATTWTALAQRLLQEQLIANRVACFQRRSGLIRLLNHPVAQQAAIAACASLAADPVNQIGLEAVCALDITEHPSTRVDQTVAAAAARMPREGPWAHDVMLAAVVDEMLSSSVCDVRWYASILIHATPYREAIATELATELSQLATASHTDLAVSIMDALRLIGGPRERPVVERFVLSPRLPEAVTAAAARNIGHLGGTSDDGFWTRAVDLQCQQLKQRGAHASEAILRSLVDGIGISRNDSLLARIRDLPDMPWQARQAATWWLGHPRWVRLSAAR
jgi:hypothetical protein